MIAYLVHATESMKIDILSVFKADLVKEIEKEKNHNSAPD